MPGDRLPGTAGVEDTAGSGPLPRYGKWVTVGAWLMLVVSLAGSLLIAVAWRSIIDRSAERSIQATSIDMGAVVSSTLQRNVDFMAALRSTLAANPRMTNREFTAWFRSVDTERRYPGNVGYVFMERVPAARLPEFRRRLLADPFPHPPTRGFEVLPAGDRPSYCLVRLLHSPALIQTVQAFGYDYCAAQKIPGVMSSVPVRELQAVADSGTFAAARLDMLFGLFAIAAPVYEGGTTPPTVAERRRKLIGWVLGTFEPDSLLASSLRAHPGMAVEILHRNVSDDKAVALAQGGSTPRHARTYQTTVDAEGPWTVRVMAPPPKAGVSGDVQFVIVLAVGSLVSVLIFGFVQVLARSRRRALTLVARRTEQLRHQASHDSLTGLPNRAHAMLQVESALARARDPNRRGDAAIALMFLDLDEFKAINDTFGHPCGDELLRAVATRLTGALREGDVVGRLGGDEFIVLLRGESMREGPGAVAERLCAVLAEPLVLSAREPVNVRVHASIGIAVGARNDADEMLRDADMALYEAKHRGKNGYVIHQPHPGPDRLSDLPSL